MSGAHRSENDWTPGEIESYYRLIDGSSQLIKEELFLSYFKAL